MDDCEWNDGLCDVVDDSKGGKDSSRFPVFYNPFSEDASEVRPLLGSGGSHASVPLVAFDPDDEAHLQRQEVPVFTLAVSVVNVALVIAMLLTAGLAPWGLAGNPWLGPDSQTLVDFGAKYTYKIECQGEWWRLITAMLLHVGVLHLALNLSVQLTLGYLLECRYGTWRVAIVYLLSGIGGNAASTVLMPRQLTMGASSCLMGLFGMQLVEIIAHWRVSPSSRARLVSNVTSIASTLAIGLLPYVDNTCHLGGLVAGCLATMVLLPSYFPGISYVTPSKVVVRAVGLFALLALSLALAVLIGQGHAAHYLWWLEYTTCIPIHHWCDNIIEAEESYEGCVQYQPST